MRRAVALVDPVIDSHGARIDVTFSLMEAHAMRRLLILVAASVLALGALPSPVGAELFVSSQNNHTVLRYDAGAGAFIPPAFVTAASGELDGPTFLVFRSSAGIPTLSEWAQIGMAALLVGGGLLAIRRRAGGSAFSDQPPAIG